MYVNWIALSRGLQRKTTSHFVKAGKTASKERSRARSHMRSALKQIAEHVQREQLRTREYLATAPGVAFTRPGNVLQAALSMGARYQDGVFVPLASIERAADAVRARNPGLASFVDAVLQKAERIQVFEPDALFPIHFTGRGRSRYAGHPQSVEKGRFHTHWRELDRQGYAGQGFSDTAARAALDARDRGESRSAARNVARSVDRGIRHRGERRRAPG